jgi:hypothetical protein
MQNKTALKIITTIILCCTIMVACKKKDTPNNTVPSKEAKFTVDISGTTVSGSNFLGISYITANDEDYGIPYAEIHIAGTNCMLDVLINNPTVKQYNVSAASDEAGIILQANGSNYETTNTSVLNITEATASKISGTISGTFLNETTGAAVTLTNCSFSAQF